MADEDNRSLNNMIENVLKNTIRDYENKNGEIEITDDELYLE